MIARSIVLVVAIIVWTTAGYATIVDLTGSNDSGTINGAQFVFTTPQPTGTGVIQPFLRVEILRSNKAIIRPAELRLTIRPGRGRMISHLAICKTLK
jgi:hypothetical protein